MSFIQGLLAGRSHLAFLGGLAVAVTTGLSLDSVSAKVPEGIVSYEKALDLSTKVLAVSPTGVALSAKERQWATIAWKYFENNYQPDTGLVNSADNYGSTTLWDLGSYLMGMLSARELDLVDQPTFDARLDKLLQSLLALPLVDGLLPNKAYDTRSLRMVNYDNSDAPKGIGWSAIDVARLAVPMTILVWRHPDRTDKIRQILGRWRLDEAVSAGQMSGSLWSEAGVLERRQEGRFGYEQYAAKSLFLLGLDVSRSIRYDVDVQIMKVSGQPVAYDARLPGDHGGTHNAVTSEPYLLEAIEYGLDATTLPLARSLFLAQKNRHAETGIVTAVSEDNLDRAPYFTYGTVLNDRKPWATFTPTGVDAGKFRSVSLKAALGWSFVFNDAYSDTLSAYVGESFDPARGWYSGRYEADGSTNRALTANTNGIILEMLAYRARGPLLRGARSLTAK